MNDTELIAAGLLSESSKIKVCFVLGSAGKYGAERSILELIEGLVKLGVIPLVILPKNGPLCIQLSRSKIKFKVFYFPKWRSRRVPFIYRIVRNLICVLLATRLARVIKKEGCDLVYTSSMVASIGAYAAYVAGKPHIWHSHESEVNNPLMTYDLPLKVVLNIVEQTSVFFVVVSHALKEFYAPYLKQNKLQVIYQSVKTTEIMRHPDGIGYDSEFFTAAIVGSLNSWKGQAEAIDAIAELIRRGIKARLLIIGDGPRAYSLLLSEKVKGLGLDQQIIFLGYVANPVNFTSVADVVLVCSHWEAFGRSAIEAMLIGKPVIGRRGGGGTDEMILDKVTGLLYDSSENEDLPNKMQYLYENSAERLRLGAAAHNWAVLRFTQKRYAEDVNSLLRRAVQPRIQG